MKVILLTVGGAKERWLKIFLDEYVKKIGFIIEFAVEQLKKKNLARTSALQKKKMESEALLSYFRESDYVVLFDESGRSMNSFQFSKAVEISLHKGRQRVIFVIAGAYGASEELKARAQEKWSLSPLTFNHHIAQAIAVEQIYRALTIWKGIRYHNE
jgi:23S rRNA (pseudouridine1915-N3)-methyltransferase